MTICVLYFFLVFSSKKYRDLRFSVFFYAFSDDLIQNLTIIVPENNQRRDSEEICKFLAIEIVVDDSVKLFPHRKSLADLPSVAFIVLVS